MKILLTDPAVLTTVTVVGACAILIIAGAVLFIRVELKIKPGEKPEHQPPPGHSEYLEDSFKANH